MLTYYSSIIILSWIALGILCVLVYENDRISRENKRLYYLTFVLIAASALAEWAGLRLNGNESVPVWLLQAIKCCDYILTPLAGGALVGQMRLRNRWSSALWVILGINAVFQIVSGFTGWMLTIDHNHEYHHGPHYSIYIFFYFAVIVLVIACFLIYGRSFRKQNRISLYAIIGMVVTGILMQELAGGEVRTAYISLTIGVAMMFIHSTEFAQLATDEHVLAQQVQIKTDALTGVLSRHAYTEALKELAADESLPENLAVLVIDINELKTVNDTLGHEAGDELICGASRCIEHILGKKDRCYRTGGDEFVVLAHMSREEADTALKMLEREAQQWRGTAAESLSLAAGFALASDYEGISCEELVKEADKAMYEAKTAYYRASGKDRRRRY